MNQNTHAQKNNIGVQAAAAATNGIDDADDDNEGVTIGSDGETKKTRQRRKAIFVVTGEVFRFHKTSEAEAFLNSDEAPERYQVITGEAAPTNQRVSLKKQK
jgi:hypothetical protein